MGVVDLGELVAPEHEEGHASNELEWEKAKLTLVFLHPGVVGVGHNGQVIAASARHHQHSLSKSLVRFSHAEQVLRFLIEIFELSARDFFEHFIFNY